MKGPSIFTKIIRGELPCYKIYEDEFVISLLALDQVTLGHTLLVPKVEVDHWFQVPEKDFLHLQKISQKLAPAIKQATGANRILTATIGFEVSHCHLHLIPAQSMSDLNFAKAQRHPEAVMKNIQQKIVEFIH